MLNRRGLDIDAGICLPYGDPDVDEDRVRQQAIDKLAGHDDPNEPVFQDSHLGQFHVCKDPPPFLAVSVMDLDGLCFSVSVDLTDVEFVEKLQEDLEEAKDVTKAETEDGAAAEATD